MGGTARRVRPGGYPAVTVSPRLAELIGSGQFDWDNEKHREAYLRAWVNGVAPPPSRPEPEGQDHA